MKIELGGSMTLLTMLFVVLKVTNYINWSWWWVFAPLWIGGAIALLILLFIVALVVLKAIL